MQNFALTAKVRNDLGKGASRRLRRLQNLVPAIVYGGSKEPQAISLLTNELVKLLENDAAFSHVLSLNIDGAVESVLIKDLQRHPAKENVLHVDFIRVLADQKLTALVPLHFINEDVCVAVKQQGGEISHSITEVEVSCLPKDLPEFIEVDVTNIAVGQVLHLSDLKLPKGVELISLIQGSDLAVLNVHAAKVQADASTEQASE